MTVVKNLAFCNKNKLKNLKSFIDSELDLSAFMPFPIDLLHHFVPFKLKFLKESFVVIENGEINALITVAKTGKKQIKITRLLLEENSLERGKMLVNCTTSIFLAKGAESFYIIANKSNAPLLRMLISGCGFRSFACETIFKITKNVSEMNTANIGFEFIQSAKKAQLKSIKNLAFAVINSYQKTFFFNSIFEADFKPFNKCKNFVLFDETKTRIISYFSITKLNKSDYILNFVILPAFEGYILDIVRFAKLKVLSSREFKNLYVTVKSYFSNYEEIIGILSSEYKSFIQNDILTKDFVVTKKQEFDYERMIFNDATPAF